MRKKLKYDIRNCIEIVLITIASFIIASFLNLISQNGLSLWNKKIYDKLWIYRIKNKRKIDPKIVHVDLNDSSLKNNKIIPTDREIYSDIIYVLNKARVKYIVFDIVFLDNNNDEKDKTLIESVKRFDNAILPIIPDIRENAAVSQSDPKSGKKFLIYPQVINEGNPIIAKELITSFAALNESAKNSGHILVESDDDGVLRKIPLLVKYKDGYLPTLSLKIALDYLKVNDKNIMIKFGEYILLKGAKLPNGNMEDIKIPINNRGETYINYLGLWNDTFSHYSFETILS
ncbi:MAG TPA: CHASE2 domain-containing protein, partial [Spirochaetota bacterium]|nr:CHASE2 domain-containing protein [Spirochaetota bacterium]